MRIILSLLSRRLLDHVIETAVWYAGRGASASPAVGSLATHRKEQRLIIHDAFTLG